MVSGDAHDDFVPVERMDLIGQDISLDFSNTATGRTPGLELAEKLRTYGDLVTWAERVGVVSEERAARLRRAASRSPEVAAAVLDRARELRESIYRVFATDDPEARDLERLGEAVAEAAARRRLVRTEQGYAYGWPESDELAQMLWPVALSAAELLTSEDRTRVKECASDTCNWLFLDMSRNRSRRWCDMKDCGNRAKARRYYRRQREGG